MAPPVCRDFMVIQGAMPSTDMIISGRVSTKDLLQAWGIGEITPNVPKDMCLFGGGEGTQKLFQSTREDCSGSAATAGEASERQRCHLAGHRSFQGTP